MSRQKQQIIDPMFAPRIANQTVPTYQRRASHYVSVSVDKIMDIRPGLVAAQPVPAESPHQRSYVSHGAAAAHKLHRIQKADRRIGASTPKNQSEAVLDAGADKPSFWQRLRPSNLQTAALYSMAGTVFLVGILVSLNGAHANRQVAAQVKHSQQKTEAAVADVVVPSAVKPTAAAVAHYTVSPNVPRYVDIPKLKVHTRILSEGVTKSGQLQVPWNVYDTGWYNASSQPGQQGGMLIDGHSGIGKLHGVFYQLASLVVGDQITVIRGDNQKFTYSVVKVQTVDASTIDMASMLVSNDTSKPGLNLITCAGDRIPGTEELNKRVQVYAVLQ